jgi:hypothetical protein
MIEKPVVGKNKKVKLKERNQFPAGLTAWRETNLS